MQESKTPVVEQSSVTKGVPEKTAKLNLNTASAKQIAKSIKGFGKKRSEAIVAYRDEHGKFTSVNDLAKVRGISQRFVANRLELLNQAVVVK